MAGRGPGLYRAGLTALRETRPRCAVGRIHFGGAAPPLFLRERAPPDGRDGPYAVLGGALRRVGRGSRGTRLMVREKTRGVQRQQSAELPTFAEHHLLKGDAADVFNGERAYLQGDLDVGRSAAEFLIDSGAAITVASGARAVPAVVLKATAQATSDAYFEATQHRGKR